ncbi:hypothetical protein D3C87_1284290 [compost metagenome]
MKNTAKILGLALGVVLSWQSVNAKTILISDIDDTIKLSHILDKTDAFWNVFRTENVYLGMNTAYKLLKEQDKSIEFFYVSNGPKAGVGPLHDEFLDDNKFPDKDNAFYRKFGYPDPNNPGKKILGLDPNHKVNVISEIIESTKPDLVILVGDNGEQDPFKYDTIVNKYPNTKFLSQIHMPYYTGQIEKQYAGQALQGDQEGFATSYDMILSWFDKGIINAEAVVTFEESFRKGLAKEDKYEDKGEMAFPDWTDCRDVKLDASPILHLPSAVQDQARLTFSIVHERCQIPALKH